MSNIAYPSILHVSPKRLWALVWGMLFFICINAAIVTAYGQHKEFERLEYSASYEDVMEVIETIQDDPREKIVFLGGSVLWASNTPDANDTIPAALAKYVSEDVAIYNLGMIAARPLDAYVMILLLQDHTDLFIMDYNYEFGAHVERDRLIREPETYIRLRQLYNAHADELYQNIPGMLTCLDTYGLDPVPEKTVGEASVRSFIERNLPVLRYKNRINDSLFGQHPLLLIERMVLEASDVLRGRQSLAALLQTPIETVSSDAWEPKGTEEEKRYQESFQSTVFADEELLHCMTRAFADYASATDLPLITYITPNNPRMFPQMHGSSIHQKNIELLMSLFAGTHIVNMDDGSIDGQYFADSTHFTPEGNAVLAKKLAAAILSVFERSDRAHHDNSATPLKQ